MKPDRLHIKLFVTLLLAVLGLGFVTFLALQRQSTIEDLQERPLPTVTVETPGPVRTKVVTTPGPTRTVYISRASRNQVSRQSAPATSSSVSSTLACIRKHESGGRYTATNGIYRGAYQMSTEYSDTWARRAGYEEWASKPADKWPPAVQDAVAANMGRSGWGHWSKWTSYNCPGF
jgi:hypothetical protein